MDGYSRKNSGAAEQGSTMLESHVRSFSYIEGLQQERFIRYTLWCSDGSLCVEICEADGENCVHCTLPRVTETTARRLLQFLYENAAAPEQARDVLQDLCAARQ